MLKREAFTYVVLFPIVFSSLLAAQVAGRGSISTGNPRPGGRSSRYGATHGAQANLARQAPYPVCREYPLFNANDPDSSSEVLLKRLQWAVNKFSYSRSSASRLICSDSGTKALQSQCGLPYRSRPSAAQTPIPCSLFGCLHVLQQGICV